MWINMKLSEKSNVKRIVLFILLNSINFEGVRCSNLSLNALFRRQGPQQTWLRQPGREVGTQSIKSKRQSCGLNNNLSIPLTFKLLTWISCNFSLTFKIFFKGKRMNSSTLLIGSFFEHSHVGKNIHDYLS